MPEVLRRFDPPPERRVRPTLIVVLLPGRHGGLGIGEIGKPVLVQALVPKLAVEALHEAVLDRLARPDEIQPNAAAVRPAGFS